MKRIFAFFVVLSMLLMTACKKEVGQTTTAGENKAEEKQNVNFLTGLETDAVAYSRPVAVTVNNLEASLPQYGIGQADIIMEFPVEGGITRLMTLYGDYKNVPEVCSVRSCRYYFPIFAKGFDAVYFCYGSNEALATPTLERLGTDYIDGNKAGDSLVFDRDEERLEIYSAEHTVYLKGENMKEIFEKYGFSPERKEDYGETAFDFSDKRESFLFECTGITGSFSSSYSSAFEFDGERGAYLKSHNGERHIDSRSEEQLSFTNVLFFQTEVSRYGDTSLAVIDWHGGKGYYATMGTVEEIFWEKEKEDSPIRLTDSSGNPLKLNRGKSYIGVGAEEVIMSKSDI